MKKTACAAICALLVGCVSTAATVEEFNGDSVKVNVDMFLPMDQQKEVAGAEATRVCQAGGKRRAEFASYADNGPDYMMTLLYLCLN